MPRKKTEAAAFLDIYKLVVEKKRLEEELGGMDQRRQLICDRLAVLENQIATLEQSVEQLRAGEGDRPSLPDRPTSAEPRRTTYETFTLDY
jgi:phage shock protein A